MKSPAAPLARTALVYFTLDPIKTYYWKEITAPRRLRGRPRRRTYSFTTPNYSNSATAEQKPVVTVENVLYRKVTLTKVDSEGDPSPPPSKIKQDERAVKVWLMNDGELVESTVDTVATGADGKAEFYLPTGNLHRHGDACGRKALSEAEKAYFSIINDNTTFTIAATDTAKELNFKNPGKGVLTILRRMMKTCPWKTCSSSCTSRLSPRMTTTLSPRRSPMRSRRCGGPDRRDHLRSAAHHGRRRHDRFQRRQQPRPGWYRLHEVKGDANENYVLAKDVVVKVTADNFGTPMGDNDAGSTEVTVINTRKGYLNVSKAYENVPGSKPRPFAFDVYSDENCTEAARSAPSPSPARARLPSPKRARASASQR